MGNDEMLLLASSNGLHHSRRRLQTSLHNPYVSATDTNAKSDRGLLDLDSELAVQGLGRLARAGWKKRKGGATQGGTRGHQQGARGSGSSRRHKAGKPTVKGKMRGGVARPPLGPKKPQLLQQSPRHKDKTGTARIGGTRHRPTARGRRLVRVPRVSANNADNDAATAATARVPAQEDFRLRVWRPPAHVRQAQAEKSTRETVIRETVGTVRDELLALAAIEGGFAPMPPPPRGVEYQEDGIHAVTTTQSNCQNNRQKQKKATRQANVANGRTIVKTLRHLRRVSPPDEVLLDPGVTEAQGANFALNKR